MDERVIQFRIGVMVLASAIIAAILLVMFGEGPELFRSTYRVRIMANEAAGVTAKTPVRRRGILIGRIRDVDFDEEARGVVLIAEIDSQFKIRDNEICVITAGLLGEAEVDFVPPEGQPLSPVAVRPGASIRGTVRHGPSEVIGNLEQRLAQTASSVTATSDDLGKVIRRIDRLLADNEENINRIVAKANDSMDIVQEAVGNLNDLISDPELRQRLREALADAPELIRQTKETVGSVNRAFTKINEELPKIEGFMNALEEQGPGIVNDVAQAAGAAAKLDRLADDLLAVSQALRSREGSLGQLIHDPDLYENLNRAAANIEGLTRQLRPILSDARVFSDKIARHPELLGVRGALQRHPGTKGLPHLPAENLPALWTGPRPGY